MIQLGNRTEFSFRMAYGTLDRVLATNQDDKFAAICDRHGTWGHYQWQVQCDKVEKKPIFGVELHVCIDESERTKQQHDYMRIYAKNNEGLKQLYDIVTHSTGNFYYEPRIDYQHIYEELKSGNIIVVSGDSPDLKYLEQLSAHPEFYVGISPATPEFVVNHAISCNCKLVAMSDVYMPQPENFPAYEIVAGRNSNKKTTIQHILTEDEWRSACNLLDEVQQNEALRATSDIAGMCNARLEQASMVEPERPDTLLNMCLSGAEQRGLELNEDYMQRLNHELKLIKDKDFEDYFYLVADLCIFAKKHMLVGPARGSSCGSLVCYLLFITEVDPLPYDLLFERFIDVNRMDYPDIDIDFPDTKRQMVFDYLEEKYGSERVARLGTVGKYKPKSCIGDVSKALKVPKWKVEDFKGAIIERSGGDSRAAFCIMDTFQDLEVGQKLLEEHPELAIASELEGHSTHTGQHAAGMLVTREPVSHYVPVDLQTGAAQVDKIDAESLNLLKIDALGLRTLSVIEDCLEQVDWSYEKLINYPTDYAPAFDVLNSERWAGIFQFEGYALQSVTKQMDISHFEDIVSITALARPGPLNSGGTSDFIRRKNGIEEVTHLHPVMEPITNITYGTIVYQEQVMQIVRSVGNLSWSDTSFIRKAMSKSLGKEFFDKFWRKFRDGAATQDIDEDTAKKVWDQINTMGSWSFNRSHAVAYGLISYWCCVLKAQYPLEFAVACLRNAKDDDQSIKILRELDGEGIYYKPYDRYKSQENWSVHDGVLIGGTIGIKGVGPKTAPSIARKIANGEKLTPKQEILLSEGTTPYDMVFEGRDRWGHIYANPSDYNINSNIVYLNDIKQESSGEFVFMAKLAEKNLRDHNELQNLEKRGGVIMKGQSLFLNMTLEDDTGPIIASVSNKRYLKLGVPLVEEGRIGDWYIWKGFQRGGFRKVFISRFIKITDNPKYLPKDDSNYVAF